MARALPCRLFAGLPSRVPLMLAAGRHVLKNMGGADDCSWASILSAAGYVPQLCDCGLGEVAAVRELYARHARVLCATNE